MATDDDIPVLHRYFMWANRMRDLFDKTHAQSVKEATVDGKINALIWWASDSGMFMSYWYASLYVVIEGGVNSTFMMRKSIRCSSRRTSST